MNEDNVFKDLNIFIKLIFIGDSSVGKTCFVQRYVNGDLEENVKPTIGIDSFEKIVSIPEDSKTKAKITIYDTAG